MFWELKAQVAFVPEGFHKISLGCEATPGHSPIWISPTLKGLNEEHKDASDAGRLGSSGLFNPSGVGFHSWDLYPGSLRTPG